MLFALDKESEVKLERLFEVNNKNVDVLLLLRNFLVSHEKDIKENDIKSSNITKSYIDKIVEHYHLKDEEIISYLNEGVSLLDEKIIEENPYYKNIRFENVSNDKWTLKNDKYEAYEAFVYRSHISKRENYYQEIPQIGFFKKSVSFPAVFENDVLWMSVTPNEINTMSLPIQKAKGDVITFGLGLGYFAYMASNKEDVKTLTIVEKDEEVIDLFKKHILPHFEHQEKITIVKEDAFEYMKTKNMSAFDYIFVDLHHDASDGLNVFLKSKSILKDIKADFWILDSIILLARKMIISTLEDYYYQEDYSYDNYQFVYSSIKYLLKDDVFATFDQIDELLSDSGVLKMLENISLLK